MRFVETALTTDSGSVMMETQKTGMVVIITVELRTVMHVQVDLQQPRILALNGVETEGILAFSSVMTITQSVEMDAARLVRSKQASHVQGETGSTTISVMKFVEMGLIWASINATTAI